MVAVPPPTAVTSPSPFTVAIFSLELLQLMVISSVVSNGKILGMSVSVLPFSKNNSFLFKAILLMDTFTITSQVAIFPPQLVVIVVFPAPTAVISPVSVTVAIDSSELLQMTVFSSVVSSGKTVAISVSLLPFSKVMVLLFNVTPRIGTFTVT